MNDNKMLQAALEYAVTGWAVFPVYWPNAGNCGCGNPKCDNEAKHPLTPNGLKDATTDCEIIKYWWAKWPRANVGIVTGKVSGLVVVDTDGPNCAELLRQQGIFLPKTAAVQTGRGFHGYYAHPGGDAVVSNRVALLTDGLTKDQKSQVDIRGDGGYVVAPPSIHKTGRVYQWAIQPVDRLAPLPDDLIALLEKPDSATAAHNGEDWVSKVIDGVSDGQRHDVLAKLAGYFLRLNSGHEESAYFALRTWNQLNKPPLPDRDLLTTVRSIANRERKQRERETRQSDSYTRLEVLDGAAWAEEVKDLTPRKGIPAPLPTLEELGGLVGGDVVVLAGGAGMGKTTHACRIIADVCLHQKVPTIFFTTEMTRKDVARWVTAILDGCSVDTVKQIPERILTLLRSSPIKIADAGTVTINDIETIVRGAMGTRLVIIDHLTRIVTPRKESRTLEVGDVCRRLKSLAKDSGLTMIELCQLNREGNDNTRPRLQSLRDSGEIEQEADAVLFLWTAEKNLTGRFQRMAFYLAKNRHGAVIETVVNWDKELKEIEVID